VVLVLRLVVAIRAAVVLVGLVGQLPAVAYLIPALVRMVAAAFLLAVLSVLLVGHWSSSVNRLSVHSLRGQRKERRTH